MASFSIVIREAMMGDPEIAASHINLSEHLSLDERVIRRLMCTRLWPDGLLGVKNLDFERLRSDYHAGVQAARRIRRAMARRTVDVIHFHRQGTAYASLSLMARLPSIVSIDATQDIMIDAARSRLERSSYSAERGDGWEGLSGRTPRSCRHPQWAADCLRRRYPDCRTPVHIMPAPVRLRSFETSWIEERWVRARAPGYRPKVVFIGDDFVGRGATICWTRGARVASTNRRRSTSSPTGRFRRRTCRASRSSDVTSAAYSPEWSDVWKSADVFVLPTTPGGVRAPCFRRLPRPDCRASARGSTPIPEISPGRCGPASW